MVLLEKTFLSENELTNSLRLLIQLVGAFIAFISFVSLGMQTIVFYGNRALFKCAVSHSIVNLMIVDFLRLVMNMSLFIYSLSLITADVQNDLTHLVICNLNSIFTTLFETVQLAAFVIISFERLRCVSQATLTIEMRVRFTLRLISSTWFVSMLLSGLVFFLISYMSEYENLRIEKNKCFIDYFHILTLLSGSYGINSTNELNSSLTMSKNQNIIFDFYNILITLIALFSATFFYTRISLFLKKHFKHMNKPKITSVTKNSDSTKRIQIYDYEASTTQSPNELLNVSFQGLHLILFYSIHFFPEI